MRSNFRNLYADIAWFGLVSGSVLAFINIYAARLGASALAIGLLTAGPAVVNLFFSLPAARWLEGRSFIAASFWAALAQRMGYVALIFLPSLLSYPGQVAGMIWITLLMSVPGTLLAISFNAMLAEVIPTEYRAEVVGKRNALLAICQTLAALVCGQVLKAVAFPWNYQIVFIIGAVGALLSSYHLGRLVPHGFTGEVNVRTRLRLLAPGWGSKLTGSPAEPVRAAPPNGSGRKLNFALLRGAYGRFMVAYLLFYTFQYLCLPLFPLAFVDTLSLSDEMISLGNGLFYACMFLISLRLNKLAHRFGHHWLLTAGAIGLALYPVLIGLARGVPLYLAASVLGGVVWGVLSASLVNRLIERAPEESRASSMAFHNVSLNIGILVGSLAGPLLAEWIGLSEAILVGAGLRFLAGVLMIWWG